MTEKTNNRATVAPNPPSSDWDKDPSQATRPLAGNSPHTVNGSRLDELRARGRKEQRIQMVGWLLHTIFCLVITALSIVLLYRLNPLHEAMQLGFTQQNESLTAANEQLSAIRGAEGMVTKADLTTLKTQVNEILNQTLDKVLEAKDEINQLEALKAALAQANDNNRRLEEEKTAWEQDRDASDQRIANLEQTLQGTDAEKNIMAVKAAFEEKLSGVSALQNKLESGYTEWSKTMEATWGRLEKSLTRQQPTVCFIPTYKDSPRSRLRIFLEGRWKTIIDTQPNFNAKFWSGETWKEPGTDGRFQDDDRGWPANLSRLLESEDSPPPRTIWIIADEKAIDQEVISDDLVDKFNNQVIGCRIVLCLLRSTDDETPSLEAITFPRSWAVVSISGTNVDDRLEGLLETLGR